MANPLKPDVRRALPASSAFRQLDPATQASMLRELGARGDPYAMPLETPDDLRERIRQARERTGSNGGTQPAAAPAAPEAPRPKVAATDAIAARAGALSDEINFPSFVAGLVHGTFDAIVDASIRQMETFADLVSAVAKGPDQFTKENVTLNQARDYLASQYPRHLMLDLSQDPRLVARPQQEGEEDNSPSWLADFGLEGRTLDEDFIEQELLPAAQRKIGDSRLQMLATMVLLGMNRVVVRDGTISARLKFRAAASDKTKVDYATAQDVGASPGGSSWADRGSRTYDAHQTLVSTVGVNAQQDAVLDASLYGEVKINFASETLPLERFADSARLALLQRNAAAPVSAPAPVPVPAPAAPAPAPPVVPPGGNPR
jgi:hypothetical protein